VSIGDSLPQILIRKPETPSGELTPSGPSYGLPPELLASAGRRLAQAALTYAAVYALTWAVSGAALSMGAMEDLGGERELWSTLTLVFVVLSLGMWALARSGRVAPETLLDVALVYEVVGAVGIDIGIVWVPAGTSPELLTMLSWTAVWIVVFPLLVPATPGKTLVAALIAASMKPLFVLIVIARGAPAPAPGTMLLIAFPNFVCALLAYTASRVVYGLGREVGRARRLGSYHLTERLGAGGMGEVWRAEHRLLARPAAIKLIRAGTLGADGDSRRQMLKRFEREAQATAALSSPHTVQLHDFGIADDGTFYYVMELLHGLDADQLVRRFGPLPPARAVHVLSQVCESLAEAHHAGLVHRDIKPANVYLCRRGLVHDFVKVLDFGLVKAAGAAGRDETMLTGPNAAAGTPAFMAPELALGTAEVDGRADIYAVGCLAYWLLTGKLVFEQGNAMQVALAHVHTEPEPPSRRSGQHIPVALEVVVMACLAKDREQRPRSAEELGRLLDAAAVPEPWDRDDAARWWRANLSDLAA
jgi:serine/threonine-protein kinase